MKQLIVKHLVAVLLLGLLAPACANSPTDQSIDDTANLEMSLQVFHRDMRWGRWESAVAMVAPEDRNAFLGRYEELGDDFKIVDLDLKSVQAGDRVAVVDLEQQSYKEPNPTVKKERIVEVWELRDKAWIVTDRMKKDEYRRMLEEEQDKAEKLEEATKDDDSDDPQSDLPQSEDPSSAR